MFAVTPLRVTLVPEPSSVYLKPDAEVNTCEVNLVEYTVRPMMTCESD